jgi:hypothetical protein
LKFVIPALGVVIFVSASAPSSARTLRVPAEYATLQAGVDAAVAGDTVLAAPGTYRGSGNRDVDFRGKGIVVRGEFGPEQTIVDCQANADDPHRGFFLGTQEPPGTLLEGFTIVNGFMSTQPSKRDRVAHDLSAGGIKIQTFAAPTIRDCIVRNCGSEYTGGGISVENVATAVLEDVVVEGCFAGILGGGISIETQSNATLRRCIVTGNRAPIGGGIECQNDVVLEDCVVAGNAATTRAGGIEVLFPARVQATRTIVWGNCAPEPNGGELYVGLETTLALACSVYDPARVVVEVGGNFEATNGNVTTAPRFCFPLACTRAPIDGGDYTVQDGSPCLASASPCGQTIGALGRGCSSQTPAVPTTWTHIKATYR